VRLSGHFSEVPINVSIPADLRDRCRFIDCDAMLWRLKSMQFQWMQIPITVTQIQTFDVAPDRSPWQFRRRIRFVTQSAIAPQLIANFTR